MPLEPVVPGARWAWAGRMPAAWCWALARLAAAWGLLLGLTFADWAAMAGQWWHSSTYAHVLLVPPIIAWLVAQRASLLGRLTPLAWAPGLGMVALAMALWLAGRLAGVAEMSEAGAVAALGGAAVLMLGPRVSAGLAFPLCYMMFLVPIGDELIPTLQTITATLTIALVHASGIRASIDGVFIGTPAGLFQIAAACSGVKFLVAMVAFGVLAAHVCFLSWVRRGVFLAACVIVPVLANGVRAWGTIAVGQWRGAAYAGSFDHIVYGWIFFALVIAAILAGAWRWFDRPARAAMVDIAALQASPLLARLDRFAIPSGAALAGLGAIALGVGAWAGAAERLAAPMPHRIDLPEVAGWHRIVYCPRHWWAPRAAGASHRLLGAYADPAGDEVDVFYALYASQGAGRKAGGTSEGAASEWNGWAWQAPGPPMAGALSQRLLAPGPIARLATTTYRTGTLATGSNMGLRLANFRDKALLRARPTMLLILSAEERPGHPAVRSIAAFRAAIGPLGPWMDALATPR